MTLKDRPISNAAKSIKFEEDLKIMAHGYKLWRKQPHLPQYMNNSLEGVFHKFYLVLTSQETACRIQILLKSNLLTRQKPSF
jgi:hypothetical protein